MFSYELVKRFNLKTPCHNEWTCTAIDQAAHLDMNNKCIVIGQYTIAITNHISINHFYFRIRYNQLINLYGTSLHSVMADNSKH